jgi:phosphoenolpyruvate-protein kinase (PTS system EI component)
VRIRVNANLGSLDEVAPALERGAEGLRAAAHRVPLPRSARGAGARTSRRAEYQRIAARARRRPLAIRTLDAGGDKPIAYLPMPREENPALGPARHARELVEAAALRDQLRAILRVRRHGQCRVLLPMVTDVDELRARARARRRVRARAGVARRAVGAMIETPASALLAERAATRPTSSRSARNDLAQYTLAIDRGHPELARRLDALAPAVLRLIALVADAARARASASSSAARSAPTSTRCRSSSAWACTRSRRAPSPVRA